MRAWHITSTEGLPSLKLQEIKTSVPGKNEVLVRIQACSLNYRDYMNVTGIRGITGPIPRVPCSDGAGVIEAIGPEVKGWHPGQRVVIPFMPTWLDGAFTQAHAAAALGGAVDGLLREFATVPASSLIEVPEYLSLEEAATLPCAALTAWNALHVRGQLQSDETVLILGTGGVSIFALQFAIAAGARVLAITSSDEKAKRLLSMGAYAVMNYRENSAWDEWALTATQGLGVDKVIEIGGPETLNRSIQATRFGGHISLIGVLTGTAGDIQTVSILRKGIRLDGIYVGSKSMLQSMLDHMTQSQLHPVIDQIYGFTEASSAFARMESARHFGKIVIRV